MRIKVTDKKVYEAYHSGWITAHKSNQNLAKAVIKDMANLKLI